MMGSMNIKSAKIVASKLQTDEDFMAYIETHPAFDKAARRFTGDILGDDCHANGKNKTKDKRAVYGQSNRTIN